MDQCLSPYNLYANQLTCLRTSAATYRFSFPYWHSSLHFSMGKAQFPPQIPMTVIKTKGCFACQARFLYFKSGYINCSPSGKVFCQSMTYVTLLNSKSSCLERQKPRNLRKSPSIANNGKKSLHVCRTGF